jgi:hypothetical protein
MPAWGWERPLAAARQPRVARGFRGSAATDRRSSRAAPGLRQGVIRRDATTQNRERPDYSRSRVVRPGCDHPEPRDSRLLADSGGAESTIGARQPSPAPATRAASCGSRPGERRSSVSPKAPPGVSTPTRPRHSPDVEEGVYVSAIRTYVRGADRSLRSQRTASVAGSVGSGGAWGSATPAPARRLPQALRNRRCPVSGRRGEGRNESSPC